MTDRAYSTAHALSLPSCRGLSRTQAAAYIGVGASLFDIMVADKRMPDSIAINRRRVWDREALDAAFTALHDGAGTDDGEGEGDAPPKWNFRCGTGLGQ